MAEIEDKVKQIREARYGKEVRESIASGIESINQKANHVTAFIEEFEEQVASGYFKGEKGEQGEPGSIENIDLSAYEKKINKVNEINSASNSTQYASAKAVYDYVQSYGKNTIIFSTSDIASGVLSYTIPNIENYQMIIVRCGASFNNNTTVSIPLTPNAAFYATTAFITNDLGFVAAAAMHVRINGSTVNLTTHWSRTWLPENLRIFEIFGVT